MERPPLADSPEKRPASRPKLFLLGLAGLPVSLALALAVDAVIAGGGRVSSGFFVAAAALTAIVGLGLLLQLVAALAGRTRGMLRELKRFNEEMAAEPPELSEDSQRQRRATWLDARSFTHVLGPFVTGLALQLLVTEAAALLCLVTDVDERWTAIAMGIEVFALFNYFLFFNALLGRLAGGGSRAPVA